MDQIILNKMKLMNEGKANIKRYIDERLPEEYEDRCYTPSLAFGQTI